MQTISKVRENTPTWYADLRSAAAARFASLPETSFKYGLNIFFPTNGISQPASLTTGNPSGIRSSASTSQISAPENVSVMALSDAMQDPRFADVIRDRLSIVSDDRIDAWHLASIEDGVFVHVPAGVTAAAPVHSNTRHTAASEAALMIVFAEQGSVVTVVEHLSSMNDAVDATSSERRMLRSSRVDVVVQPGAKVTHVAVQDFGNDVTSFEDKRAVVGRDGEMTWIDCAFGGDFVRSRIATDLIEPGASARVMSMCFAAGNQRFDLRHVMSHKASHTASDIRTRNALAGTAKAIYRGLVRVEAGTRGCNGRQKEDTLLLSPDAEIDAMPDLEIGTGDVRAGHSASAGGLDKEKLFYLMSRGLDRDIAARTLIEAFFEPVERDMRGSGMEEMVNCLITARLENKPAEQIKH